MRKQPGSPPNITKKQIDTIITQERVYELFTPLFGGGVTPREADPVTIVRGTEIRGQLRFWWRACRGGNPEFNGDPAKMKQAENKIWGAPYKKGEPTIRQDETVQITIEVPEGKKGEKVSPNPAIVPPYAAFPLQPSEAERQAAIPPKDVLSNVTFKLTISFPADRRKDVEAALWSWETFGGIGARTRRGFGALRCTSITENKQSIPLDLPPDRLPETKGWIQRGLSEYVTIGPWPVNVPHLTRQAMEGSHFKLINRTDSSNPLTSWKDLIDQLRKFRQQRLRSHEGIPNRGRSRWPEPTAIRELTGQSLPRHASSIPDPPLDKFPRAAFGLPIIFQFKDRNRRNLDDPNSDPRNTSLQPISSERFASPLILKPLACQEGRYIGLALILEGTRLGADILELKTQKGQPSWKVRASLDPGESLVLPDQNRLIRIDNQTDALQAFLKYL